MQPFDVKSCSQIDMSKFQWCSSQDNYQKLRKIIIEELDNWKVVNNLEQFNVIYFQVLKALVEYITIYYDVQKAKNYDQIKFDQINNNFVKNILEKKKINEIYNYDLELKRFPQKKINFLLSKFYLKLGSVFKKKLIISKNELIQTYIGNDNSFLYLPPIYLLQIPNKNSIKKNKSTKILAKSILDRLVVYDNIFDQIILDNIENIINVYLNRFEIDIKKIDTLKSSFVSCDVIVTGTGDQYFNQLISYYSKINNIKNYRFDHGGEKSFFIDKKFLNSEIQFIDSYFTYSPKLQKNYQDIFKNNNIRFNGKFRTVKSLSLEKISRLKSNIKTSGSRKIIYVQQSFIGNSRNVDIKLNDNLLYYWQFHLFKNLKCRGHKIYIKKHPKGDDIIKPLINMTFKIYDKKFSDLLSEDDIFIFDFVGTAFIEALIAKKKVILIDNQIRKVNPELFGEIRKCACVIKGFWKNNLPTVDFDNLCYEIDKFKNSKEDNDNFFYSKFYS